MKQESLNKRIRETISSLSDEELADMQNAPAHSYTSFARQVLEEELSRRRRLKAIEKDPRLVSDALPTMLRDVPARKKKADCFIEVWSDKNFGGEYLRIEGPGEYQEIESASLEWGDSISSLRVGPSAFVLVYAEKDFKGTMMSFGPGQHVPDLEEFNFNDEIDSLKLINSIKVFDGFRSEDAAKPAGGPEKRRYKGQGRRRVRGE